MAQRRCDGSKKGPLDCGPPHFLSGFAKRTGVNSRGEPIPTRSSLTSKKIVWTQHPGSGTHPCCGWAEPRTRVLLLVLSRGCGKEPSIPKKKKGNHQLDGSKPILPQGNHQSHGFFPWGQSNSLRHSRPASALRSSSRSRAARSAAASASTRRIGRFFPRPWAKNP